MAGFYEEMADTVVELLEEFGQSVTIVRHAGVFDPVLGKDTSAVDSELTTRGIWQRIHANLVDGTRIRAGDKLLVIDPTVEPLMGDKVEGWSVVDIEVVKPAGIALAYRLVVRK